MTCPNLRARWGALAFLIALSAAGPVQAQDRFDLQLFRPTPDLSGAGFVTHGATPIDAGHVELGLVGSFGWSPFALAGRQEGDIEGRLVSSIAAGDLTLLVGIHRVFDLAVDVPLLHTEAGASIQGERDLPLAESATVLGDVRVVPRLQLFSNFDDLSPAGFSLALVPVVAMPSGDSAAYAGDDGVRFEPRVVAQVDFRRGHFIAANVGASVRPKAESLPPLAIGTGLGYSLAAGYALSDGWTLLADLYGAAQLGSDTSSIERPAEALGGVRWTPGPVVVSAAGGGGFGGGVSATDWRVVFSLGVHISPNTDKDGDGIPNGQDTCPRDAEDLDGFDDSDGCVDPDNDGDGVPDTGDACPDEAEDLDGFDDSDGCVDPDNDGDGVPDIGDACPDEAEDLDGFDDSDGCVDPDNDGDGFLDTDDECPDVVGDERGCPGDGGDSDWSEALVVVRFAFDSSELSSRSRAELDRFVESLADASEDALLVIVGYTDAVGETDYNEELSQDRANAVRDYLRDAGVSLSSRVTGRGSAEPVAPNADESGRSQNRRVEIRFEGVE